MSRNASFAEHVPSETTPHAERAGCQKPVRSGRIHRLLSVLILALTLPACDLLSELTGTDSAELTEATLQGKVLSFRPDVASGGISEWEYEFRSREARGCNRERTYESSGWSVVDNNTVRVRFGEHWEQYRLVDHRGSLADGNLRGRFQYSSSPGISMEGTFTQRAAPRWC